MLLETVSFTKHNGMLQSKQRRISYFLYPPLHSTHIVFASFGSLINVLHDYQPFQVGFSSYMISTWVLPFSGFDGIELDFLQQQSCNQGETIC